MDKPATIEVKKPAASLKHPMIQSFHSGNLSNDTTPNTPYETTWEGSDYWVIVARLTGGYINISPGSNRGGPFIVRLNSGTARIPIRTSTFTVETVGATGFYSLYAVKNLDGFDISA